MAQFPGMVLTKQGLQLQSRAQTGAQLQFTSVKLGDGELAAGQSLETMTDLISTKLSLAIQSMEVIGDGTSRVRVVLTNTDLTTGFFVREIGVYAHDAQTNTDVLYSVSNADYTADFLPAGGAETIVEQIIDLFTVVGNAQNVTAVIDKHTMIATLEDLDNIGSSIAVGKLVKYVDIGSGVPGLPVTDGRNLKNLSVQTCKNKIINGNFDIWQRGTSQTSIGYGSDDRWHNGHNGSTKTHSQQAFTLGQTDVPGNPAYFSRTVVNSVQGANNAVYKSQLIEDVKSLAGKKVTLSFWAKADAARNIVIEFLQKFDTTGTDGVAGIGSTTLSLTSAWKKYTVTANMPSVVGKTIATNNATAVQFWFDAGSGYNSRTNSLGQQSGTFDIAQVQLEQGEVATEFEQRPITIEQSLCERYYEKANLAGMSFVAYGIYYAHLQFRYRHKKRAIPTFTQLSNFFTTDNSSVVLEVAPSCVYFVNGDDSYANLFISKDPNSESTLKNISNFSYTIRQAILCSGCTVSFDAEL